MVVVANLHYSKAALSLMQILKESLCHIKVVLADGGYRGDLTQHVQKVYGYLIKVVMRTDKGNDNF